MTQADTTEFADFYAVNFPRIAAQLYAYLGDHAEAQDVTQEAFVRALDRWARVSTYSHAQVWVRQVAWNLATSRLRHLQVARRYLARQRVQHADEPSPDRVALTRALATLPAKHRLAVVLHHLGQLSTAEIAQQEGVAEGTVRSWLSRGRARLAEHFEESLAAGGAHIRAPGADAAAVTVRRRRTARRATLAAVLVLALAIPVVLLLRGKGGEPPIIVPPTPSGSPSPGVSIRKIVVPGTTVREPHVQLVDGRHAWMLLTPPQGEARIAQASTLVSTSDGGNTWWRVPMPDIRGNVTLVLHVFDANTITLRVTDDMADTPREFWHTRDAGVTWTTHPWTDPPREARLTMGEYQMLCPGAHGLEDGANGTSCDRRQLVKAGSGPVSPQPPWRGDTVQALSGRDGRVWLFDEVAAGKVLAVSTDGAKTWRRMPFPPGGYPRLSWDGKTMWTHHQDAVWELTGEEWKQVFPLEGGDAPVAPVGDGLWLVRRENGMAYYRDGTFTPIPEVRSSGWPGVLPDGTLTVFADNTWYLGYGAGQDREWVLIEP